MAFQEEMELLEVLGQLAQEDLQEIVVSYKCQVSKEINIVLLSTGCLKALRAILLLLFFLCTVYRFLYSLLLSKLGEKKN